MVGERRGVMGSSVGWYLDARSETLIGKRGTSFGARDKGSISMQTKIRPAQKRVKYHLLTVRL
jgi:hypothetical protein